MGQVTETKAPPKRSVSAGGVFLGFAPWIIFTIVAGPSTWEYAALAALAASLVLSGRDILQGHLNLLDMTGIVFFAVVSVLALALDHHELIWLETYAQVLANTVVALVALGSLFFDPFTAQYARRSTPPSVWDSPVFKHINMVLTAAWGGVFVVIAVLGLLAILMPSLDDWFNWVVPIVLLACTVKFTERYPESYKVKALA
ncbi:hypothetical protein ABZ446_18515 [Streptomyces sp. NPDC005813]|uniref:hypothetical protein n=1 Tax=Streptomyces sp. NPDC005813 TaxID=3155592 RepID=UPI0033FC7CCD